MEGERVFLLPGEYHVSRIPCQIATLLGSCVAVTLWHREKHYAAMNHFLLATAPTGQGEKGRYGDSSTETLVWLMGKLDPDLGVLEAGIYGGGAVVGHLGASTDIGVRNIEAAHAVLRKHRIRVAEEETGGTQGRRIYFDTATGRVRVRMIEKSGAAEDLARRRADLASRRTRVLIVDDSALVRKILRQAVEASRDLEVCGEAEDAYQARDLILETDPDVVSLDIIMPKLDGLQFLKSLSEHYPKPVVICSTIAKDRSAVAERARTYGAVDVVDKETLELYKGLDVVVKQYVPKLRRAAATVVRKRICDT